MQFDGRYIYSIAIANGVHLTVDFHVQVMLRIEFTRWLAKV